MSGANNSKVIVASGAALVVGLAVGGLVVYGLKKPRSLPAGDTVPRLISGADKKKKWTLLVFLNANNNLDSFGDMDVREMQRADRPDINIVVQHASLSKRTVTRDVVTAGKVTTVEKLDWATTDMGDYTVLRDFLVWGAHMFPAEHYFVDVWNHGNGWTPVTDRRRRVARDISIDDHTGNAISPQQLGYALKDMQSAIGRKVDVYGSDACLMAMVEVYAELQGVVDYAVGSQEVEPGDGWPYHDWLARWGSTPREVAVSLAELYTEGIDAATLSVVDMERLPLLLGALAETRAAIEASPSEVLPAISRSYRMTGSPEFVDIASFATRFKGDSPASKRLGQAVAETVVYSRGKPPYSQASGINVWLPASYDGNLFRVYESLAFDAATKWSDGIQAYLLPSKDTPNQPPPKMYRQPMPDYTKNWGAPRQVRSGGPHGQSRRSVGI